jgi:short-subunit dehydrogenase
VKDIQGSTKNPNVEFIVLDLANLASIRNFVDEVKKRGLVVDLLINNAGVMVSIITLRNLFFCCVTHFFSLCLLA